MAFPLNLLQIGYLIGSYYANKDREDNKTDDPKDLRVQTSGYGKSIPRIVGKQRLAGNIIWSQPLKEYKWDDNVTGYKLTCAIALCEGPVLGWNRIWIDDELKVDCTDGTARKGVGKFYLGNYTQTADPTMESYEGAGNVPAYRGICYVVLNEFDLGPSDRIPKFEFQVLKGEF